jgi:1-acyl-sn-glycerol-3-phosphate acyltransferase
VSAALRTIVIFLRSLAFNVAFYVLTTLMLFATLPFYFFLPQDKAMGVVRAWHRMTAFLLRVLVGTRSEVRGMENLPPGGCLVAAKHQSAWETLTLVPVLPDPTFVMKAELRKIPFFGQYTVKAGMIHVEREGKAAALRALTERARQEIAKGRQVIMFPEGTRRPPGAPPAYQTGIALLYRTLGVPVVPMALNSGLYWPRRKFLRYPGTIIIEFLPPIPPGLDSRTFLARLEAAIETASDRLLAEAARSQPKPPFPAEAAARLAATG